MLARPAGGRYDLTLGWVAGDVRSPTVRIARPRATGSSDAKGIPAPMAHFG